MNHKSLLIVESPTKVKTIQKHLGNDYDVISCVGHVKDLPKKKLGIDIENEFKIELDVLPDKKKFINTLKKKSNDADRVLIATDPEREGEAISKHLATLTDNIKNTSFGIFLDLKIVKKNRVGMQGKNETQ